MCNSITKYVFICYALLLCPQQHVFSCTSFVIYSSKTYYGMNFDWPETEMKFCIEKNNQIKYFHFQFYKYDHYSTTVGMNEHGIFCPIQMLYPESTSAQTGGMTLWSAFLYVMQNVDNLTTFTDFLDQTDTHIMPVPGATLHNLFADTSGNAFVLEVGDDSNLITAVENGILVMTNFPNHQFGGKDYTTVYGVGADRYKAAYKYLLEHKNDFTVENGFEALRCSVEPNTSDYPTQCSMIFDPLAKEIYIVLRQDFKRIWKLSIEQESIETYAGFDVFHSTDIEPGGILDSQLEEMTTYIEQIKYQPEYLELMQNYPNPFNPSTTISYSLPQAGYISLNIYNLLGQKVEILINEFQTAGEHQVHWQADDLPSGIYLMRLQSGTQIKTLKLILQK